MRTFTHIAVLILAKALDVLFVTSLACAESNLVLNGDFSQVEKGAPAAWEACGNAKTVEQRLEAGAEGGLRFARLVCTRCDKADASSHAMLAQVGHVSLEKGKLYEVSCRVRAEGIEGRTAELAISDTSDWQNCGLSVDVPLSERWTPFKTRFKATRSVSRTTRLQLWFHEPGTLCLAEVKLAEAAPLQVAFTDVVPAGGSQNLVFNGSFECGASGWSSLGRGAGWGNLAGLHGSVITAKDAPHGRQILRVLLGGRLTPELFFDYLKPVARKETQPLAASLGWIPVKVGRPYTLSCAMRASADGVPAVLGLRMGDPDGGPRSRNDDRRTVKLATSWQRYTAVFRPHKPYAFVTVGPALDEDRAVEVDIDAVQLEEGEQASAFALRSGTEVGAEPLFAPSGVFVEGGKPELLLQSAASGPVGDKIRFEVTDYFGARVELPDAAPDAAVPLPADWKGYYRVRAVGRDGGLVSGRVLPLAIVPKPPRGDTVAGINHAFAHAPLIQLARKAGVTWYRDWSLKWQDIEPRPGEFRWEVGDAQVDRVLAEQVRLMALLPPFPSAEWCSEAPAALATKGYPGERLRQAWAPRDARELGRYVGQAAAHFKGRVGTWEFLNEPVYTDYALPGRDKPAYKKCGARGYGVQDYVDLLKIAAASMKQADPSCRVIGGIGCGPDPYALEAIAKGCLDHCDIFNLHIYPGLRPPEAFIPEMKALVAAMDAAGQRRPIWITEFSYYGTDAYPREPFIPDSANWAEERLLSDERQCADYTIRFFALMMSFGVEKIFLHSGASAAANESQFECCLFGADGQPRKVFPALAVFADLMGSGARPAGSGREGAAGYRMAFETARGKVTVLWDVSERASAAVPAGCACLDVMGRPVKGTSVALGPSPVYLLERR